MIKTTSFIKPMIQNKKLLYGILAIVVLAIVGISLFVLNRSTITTPPQFPEGPQQEVQLIDMDEALRNCISVLHLRNASSDRTFLEFIINTVEEYQALLEFRSPADFCKDFKLPPIDFSQYTLLGKYTEGGGCSIDFKRNVAWDDANKKVAYSIDIIEIGACMKLAVSMNWILVPKIPPNYNVIFEVKESISCNDDLDCPEKMKCEENVCVDVGCLGEGEVIPSTAVSPEGFKARKHMATECCEGLKSIPMPDRFDENCKLEPVIPGVIGGRSICSKCGNGICEEWETKCNCSEDCK